MCVRHFYNYYLFSFVLRHFTLVHSLFHFGSKLLKNLKHSHTNGENNNCKCKSASFYFNWNMISIMVKMQKENKSKNEMHTNQRNWYANQNQTKPNEWKWVLCRNLVSLSHHIYSHKRTFTLKRNNQTNKQTKTTWKSFWLSKKMPNWNIFQHKLRTILLKFQPAVSHFFSLLVVNQPMLHGLHGIITLKSFLLQLMLLVLVTFHFNKWNSIIFVVIITLQNLSR